MCIRLNVEPVAKLLELDARTIRRYRKRRRVVLLSGADRDMLAAH